jgi:hypothetical protein
VNGGGVDGGGVDRRPDVDIFIQLPPQSCSQLSREDAQCESFMMAFGDIRPSEMHQS